MQILILHLKLCASNVGALTLHGGPLLHNRVLQIVNITVVDGIMLVLKVLPDREIKGAQVWA